MIVSLKGMLYEDQDGSKIQYSSSASVFWGVSYDVFCPKTGTKKPHWWDECIEVKVCEYAYMDNAIQWFTEDLNDGESHITLHTSPLTFHS